MKRGVSPIVATVILFAIALVMASSAFFFFQGTQSAIQREGARGQESLLQRTVSEITIENDLTKFYQYEFWSQTVFDAAYVPIACAATCSDWLEFYFKNTGSRSIPIVTKGPAEYTDDILPTSWLLYDSENKVLCDVEWADMYIERLGTCDPQRHELKPGEYARVRINLLAGDSPCKISRYSSEALFYYEINFGNVARANGYFKKGEASIAAYDECDRGVGNCNCPENANWAPNYVP